MLRIDNVVVVTSMAAQMMRYVNKIDDEDNSLWVVTVAIDCAGAFVVLGASWR